MNCVSYIMRYTVLYIREHGELAKNIIQKSSSQYHPVALAVLVRYNQAQKCLQNVSNRFRKKNCLMQFSTACLPACLPACLMPSDKCNSIIASYFIQCCFSLTDAPQYVQCTHHGLTFVLLCVPFLFVNSRRYQFVITRC